MNCTDWEIKLYDGSDENEGILHVCMDRAWTTVCYNNYWSSQDTQVACKELGYSRYYGLLPHQFKIYKAICFKIIIIKTTAEIQVLFFYLCSLYRFHCKSTVFFINIGKSYIPKQTNDRYPILFSRFTCAGNEESLRGCGLTLDYKTLDDCTNNAVYLSCES